MSNLLILPYRRKREGRTNYKKRLVLLKSRNLRLVVRRTNRALIAQIVDFDPKGDKILCGASSLELKKLGWTYSTKNLPAAYLTGQLLASKIKKKKMHAPNAILDIGVHSTVKGSRIFAVLKGVIDAGITVPAGDDIFPVDERLTGQHIAHYYKNNKNKQQFATYKDGNIAEQVKKIMSSL
jgi:large subunit ribosomal protein L18